MGVTCQLPKGINTVWGEWLAKPFFPFASQSLLNHSRGNKSFRLESLICFYSCYCLTRDNCGIAIVIGAGTWSILIRKSERCTRLRIMWTVRRFIGGDNHDWRRRAGQTVVSSRRPTLSPRVHGNGSSSRQQQPSISGISRCEHFVDFLFSFKRRDCKLFSLLVG